MFYDVAEREGGTMKGLAIAMLVLAIAVPMAAAEWKDAALMDAGCAGREHNLSHPDDHSRSCALKCGDAGYGIVVDGKFIKFDEKGDALAAEALKNSDKKDHLRANVTGELKEDVIEVTALTLQ